MIKILKEGKLPKKFKYIYKEECSKCGCVFEFETSDCDYITRNIENREYRIQCPFCKQMLYGNNINDLECREVEEYER